MCSAQVGKTATLLNICGYAIDQAPGDMILVQPKDDEVVKFSTKRLQPTLFASQTILDRHSGRKSDAKNKELGFAGMTIHLASSKSPSDLAGKPCRYVLADELDKYPAFSGRDGSPLDLARDRTITFRNRKIFKSSTPTTKDGAIWKEWEASTREHYWIPCPHCGKYQTLRMDRLKWPKDERNPAKIRTKNLAFYLCEHCEKDISDRERLAALKHGVWVPEDAELKNGKVVGAPDSSHRGFHLSVFYSPWRSLSEIAAKRVAAGRDPAKLFVFVTQWLGEPFEEKTEKTTTTFLKTRVANYKQGHPPAGVKIITAGVDVQKDYFLYALRGWGYDFSSWLIQAGRINTWGALEDLLLKEAWGGLQISGMCIDSNYRTDEVYEFAMQFMDVVRPVRGLESIGGGIPYQTSRIRKDFFSGRNLPYSPTLWKLNTQFYKDKLSRLIHADPVAWWIHQDPAEDYLVQMCNEHKTFVPDRKKGGGKWVWVPRYHGAPNHFWDAEVYALAAADILEVASMKEEVPIRRRKKKKTRETNSRTRRGREKWIRQGKGWING